MERDIRATETYRHAMELYEQIWRPGLQGIADASEVNVLPGLRKLLFTGKMQRDVFRGPISGIYQLDVSSGAVTPLNAGDRNSHSAKASPDGLEIAFLRDETGLGDVQLWLMDADGGNAWPASEVDGWVEYLQWRNDGRFLLLGVASYGADTAGAIGAMTRRRAESAATWLPHCESGDQKGWRSICLYDRSTKRVEPVATAACSVWEAVWCGQMSIACLMSSSPEESAWYAATLVMLDLPSGCQRQLFAPKHQVGCLASSPSGTSVAFVEGMCSDRCVIAGDLKIVEVSTGEVRAIDTQGTDISYTEWRSDRHLLVAGHSGFDSMVGLVDVHSGSYRDIWRSDSVTSGGRYITVAGYGEPESFALVAESFTTAPEIALIVEGRYRKLKSLDQGCAGLKDSVGEVKKLTWFGEDKLEIHGWLLRPQAEGPHATVTDIHGGPVWQWRPRWLGRPSLHPLLLLRRGYAIFLPNPRGSAGRGQKFVGRVLGDMGGADASDVLNGIDELMRQGFVDVRRLGVMGNSYGGFLSCRLITRSTRFAAAVSTSPITNWVTEHLLSNIPAWTSLFLQADLWNDHASYLSRSPVLEAHRARAPTLNICGFRDRNAPPEEGMQFHRALLENNVTSELVMYPEEGHGVHSFPAVIDVASRIAIWFERHMPAGSRQ